LRPPRTWVGYALYPVHSNAPSATAHILIERHGAVPIIRMNRPDKKNALTRAMYAKMSTALVEGDADPAVRVHVFLGVAGAFSSGNDLADFLVIATGGEGGTEVWDFLMALAKADKIGRAHV